MRDATQPQDQHHVQDVVPHDRRNTVPAAQLELHQARSLPAAPGGHVSSLDNAQRQTLIRPWSNLLERTIATDILPRMLAGRAGDPALPSPSDAEVESFVTLVLAEKIIEAQSFVEDMTARGIRRDVILHGLLAPAARRLGDLWDHDLCDFAAVTLGMIRLNQIMRDTAEPISDAPILRGRERQLLIASAPGEQHSFGVAVIADLFRRAGWMVQSEPVMTRTALMNVVRRHWFDVVGLSVSDERGLKGLPAIIRALRRTALNTRLGIMVGGKAFADHPERAQFVGADATACDGPQALYEADTMVERAHAEPD